MNPFMRSTIKARWVALSLLILLPAAFVVGRVTSPNKNPRSSGNREFTLHQGDVIHVPEAATVCTAAAEGGMPNLFCERSPQGRYEFVFYRDSVTVWGPGGPDNPTAYYEWQPRRSSSLAPGPCSQTITTPSGGTIGPFNSGCASIVIGLDGRCVVDFPVDARTRHDLASECPKGVRQRKRAG